MLNLDSPRAVNLVSNSLGTVVSYQSLLLLLIAAAKAPPAGRKSTAPTEELQLVFFLLLMKWAIAGKVTSFVRDVGATNLTASVRNLNLRRTLCFAHSLDFYSQEVH